MCASIERQRGGGRKGDERDRLLRWLRVVQIEILRLLFLILIGRRRCRGGRQVLRVLLLSRRLLLNEVGMMGVLAVVAVAAAAAASS